jgi:hypothetical protein
LRSRAGLAAAVAALAPAAVAAGCGGAVGPGGTGGGSLPLDGRSPLVPQARQVRVLVELRRPSLAEQMARQPFSAGRQRAYVSNLGDEATALQSALRAKGVRLRRPLLFARVWNGFAATVDATDLPKLRALGLRAEPVRRFYGAAGSAGGAAAGGRVAASGGEAEAGAPAAGAGEAEAGQPAVALLDSGVDRAAPGLAGRVVRGFDAVGGDRDPSPAGVRERHGTQVAQVLAQSLGPAGGRILSIRVAGLQPDPQTGGQLEHGTTDQLLAGLERAVDPDGDGDTTDHVPVVLVGVNSPYAGFAGSPEGIAAGGARALGTLVVAPGGNEGRGGGTLGTVGSPAAAPGVLAVGALEGGDAPALPAVRVGLATSEGRALLRGTVLGGAAKPLRAPVAALAGPSQARPRGGGRALGGAPLEYFGVNASPRARGRVVVVPARPGAAGGSGGAAPRTAGGSAAAAGPPLAARASAAAEAGAAALVVCEPDPSRPLAAVPDGASGIPVIGLRGEAARKALELTPRDGGLAFLAMPEQRTDRAETGPARGSSRGPSYALAPKPDLSAPGTAATSGREVVAGTSVAAARVAAAAATVRARNPKARPDDIAAALVGTARPLGPPLASGAGQLRTATAAQARVLIEPATLALPRQRAGAAFTVNKDFTVRNQGSTAATVTLAASLSGRPGGLGATVSPSTLTLDPGARRRVTLTVTATGAGRPAGFASGRITATATAAGAGPPTAAVIGLPIGDPPPARLGTLALTPGNAGVRFTAGAVTTGADGTRAVEPLGSLRLQLVDANGRVARELTPPGGARDLLPGEYAYTLTKSARKSLRRGAYRFRAHARGPAGGADAVRTSPSFTVR